MARLRWPLGLLGAALAIRLVLFTGLQGNDDLIYSDSACELLQGGFSLDGNILKLRLGYVVPIAGLYALFGIRVACLIAPNLAASLGLVGLAYLFGRDLYSERSGRAAAAFVALIPLDIFFATEAHSDLPMTAWAGLSIYLLWKAVGAGSFRLALLSGLTFGMAHLSKEAAFLLLLPALTFVKDRKAWPVLATAAGALAVVVAGEMVFYAAATGDPFFRVHVGRGAQETYYPMNEGGRLWKRIFFYIPSFFANPRDPGFPYTGGFFLLSLAAIVWAFLRDRKRSGWMLFWFTGVALLMNLWPLSLVPYRPAIELADRQMAPLVLPGAVLAGAFFAERLLAWRPRWAWAGGAAMAVIALVSAARLHAEAVLWRQGAEWAHRELASRPVSRVMTDHRTAGLLKIMTGHEPPYQLLYFVGRDPLPPPGTYLLDNERWVNGVREWDGVSAPDWWREGPPREKVAEAIFPAPWRLRGKPGPPDRVSLSRLLPYGPGFKR